MSTDISPRTDLALEIREKYEKDNVEIKGVIINEEYIDKGKIKVSIVDIVNKNGASLMGRPIGRYITIENNVDKTKEVNINENSKLVNEDIQIKKVLIEHLQELTKNIKNKKILVVGLGNKDVTPDSLGPLVTEQIFATRHLIKEFGENFKKQNHIENIAAISPGVMGQTGMEAKEIIQAITKTVDINLVIVIDALAARSVSRLNCTFQITNTGISPGSGVGNNRKALNQDSLGVPVIAIGVPTVVDAYTIVNDMLEQFMLRQGFNDDEINDFNMQIRNENIVNMFVTPKDIDEAIKNISRIIAESINEF